MPLSRRPRSATSRADSCTSWRRRDCLFVVARDPLACIAVEYLGSRRGLDPGCTPPGWDRFLIIAENHRPADSRWRVWCWRRTARPRPFSRSTCPAGSGRPPPASGSVIWAAGDKGGIEAYALGDYASKSPLRSLARLNPTPPRPAPLSGWPLRSESSGWRRAGRADTSLTPSAARLTPGRPWASRARRRADPVDARPCRLDVPGPGNGRYVPVRS